MRSVDRHEIATVEGTHFTGALALNASKVEHVPLRRDLWGAMLNCPLIVKAVTILSVQNLAWEIQIRRSATHTANDPGADAFLARWTFAATDAVQNDGAGDYLYYIDGNDQCYRDDDTSGLLHLVLVNRSATAKLAGATGNIVVRLNVEPVSFA